MTGGQHRSLFRRVLRPALLGFSLAVGAGMVARGAELTFDLKIEHGHVADAARLVRVKEGDVVRLRCTSDQPVILHLHGYDIEKRLATGATAELAFTAYATGRFPIHLHASGSAGAGAAHDEAPLAVIEVYPR